MSAPARPLFLHISPDWCGEERVVQLFRLNGQRGLCHEQGRLAEHLAWARAAGAPPLAPWPGVRLLTGLHRVDRPDRAPIEAWRFFPWLDAALPGAVFILTSRDPEAWIADRLSRQGGRIARTYARHLRCSVTDLPEIWLADWRAHLAAVEAHFGTDPRLVRLDIERETPDMLCARLWRWIDLPRRPPRRHWMAPPRPAEVAALLDRLDEEAPPAPLSTRPDARDRAALADELASFCLAGLTEGGAAPDGVSALYARWDGAGAPLRRDGSPWPVAIGPDPRDGRLRAHAAPGIQKLERLEGVLNDILALGRADAVHVDMEDARWIGADPSLAIGPPILCHNRREGARNAVLWPLPGQHAVGLPGFARAGTADAIAYEDKADRLIWRGNLSGTVPRPDGERRGPAAHDVLRRLLAARGDPAARAPIEAEMATLPRLAFVRRFAGDADIDAGLVMAHRHREAASDPALAPFCRPWMAPEVFHHYRYQLCLAGYDHPTNVLGALNSRSVVLKEDDGWEVFYSCLFQPWKHFIPIAKGAADIREKLAWARENPSLCKAMSEAARATVARLADAALLDGLRARVLDGIARAG